MRRAGPETIQQHNTALLAKLATGRLLGARKLRVDNTVVEADTDYPHRCRPTGACDQEAG
jgi:hypothetical protein